MKRPEPVRIAYLVSQYPAPSHTFIRREIAALRARGMDIRTFSVRAPSPEEKASKQDRAAFESTVYLLPISLRTFTSSHIAALSRRPPAYFAALGFALKHRAPGLRALLWSMFHFAEAIVLARELERCHVEHLHNHFANAGANVGLIAARFLDLPWSLTLHGISETDYPAGLLLADKIAFARFVACVSWFGRAQAMRITAPELWPKMSIVRCGLDLDELASVPARRSETDIEIRIVCVGRLSPEKGHLGLLDAFAELHARGLVGRLVLVGDGPERARVERHGAALGVSGALTFRGRLNEQDTLAQIAGANLLVLPSFMEGLPIVLMEAMALGVPVVASRVAGVPELIEDGVEGLLFRASDWTDLSNKMSNLLADDALRTRMIAAARAKIEREFDVARAVEPLVARFQGAALDIGSEAPPAPRGARMESLG
ncbi:MAG: Glycosyl transferase, group 1 family protein [uncultured Sphingomonadaceae bacterium]|uniref:Glycosyl transferase, group 1 family protein n=1 Tax=uncultured Sphingomonadaceae bacterium TaxID=169976 RepID=A0A6J4RUU1_9SPHN|nr:MAG: Glycosyl transferase, group 1 family protein [uncultured Sphingomonadaceae bacterium]